MPPVPIAPPLPELPPVPVGPPVPEAPPVIVRPPAPVAPPVAALPPVPFPPEPVVPPWPTVPPLAVVPPALDVPPDPGLDAPPVPVGLPPSGEQALPRSTSAATPDFQMMARYHGLSPSIAKRLVKAREERPDRRTAVEANTSVRVTITTVRTGQAWPSPCTHHTTGRSVWQPWYSTQAGSGAHVFVSVVHPFCLIQKSRLASPEEKLNRRVVARRVRPRPQPCRCRWRVLPPEAFRMPAQSPAARHHRCTPACSSSSPPCCGRC